MVPALSCPSHRLGSQRLGRGPSGDSRSRHPKSSQTRRITLVIKVTRCEARIMIPDSKDVTVGRKVEIFRLPLPQSSQSWLRDPRTLPEGTKLAGDGQSGDGGRGV